MSRTLLRILHITPHLGGGVGRVLRNLIERFRHGQAYQHRIVCLDSVNEESQQWVIANKVEIYAEFASMKEPLNELIAQADVVHIHWWNHPLLYRFMCRNDLPAFRAVLWMHANGISAPHLLLPEILEYVDLLVVATPYSMQSSVLANATKDVLKNKVREAFSCAGYEHVNSVVPIAHAGFNAGYIGTVSYVKMHPDFLRMCSEAEIPDVKFIVCGGPNEDVLRTEAKRMGVERKFEIRGKVSDISAVLAQLDVFAYPLCAGNYGTGEQVLIEAQACGVPVVVMNSGCEKYVIDPGKTGIVANTAREFTKALEYLYRNPQKRMEMGVAARAYARERFCIARSVNQWEKVYEEAVNFPKRTHVLYKEGMMDGADLFVKSLGDSPAAEAFKLGFACASGVSDLFLRKIQQLPPIFFSESNGSILQYSKFIPEDGRLANLANVLLMHRHA